MKNLIKKLLHSKFFLSFAFLIILMFPTTIYKQADNHTRLVATTIGIDKSDDGYEITTFRVDEKYSEEIVRCLEGRCSVLEMLIALAIRCEETIMDNPAVGDRTGQWFWGMITNLGLGSMIDYNYNREYVEDVVARFIDNDYEPNGRGGLFTIKNCNCDLRDVEIWKQLCWYLDDLA